MSAEYRPPQKCRARPTGCQPTSVLVVIPHPRHFLSGIALPVFRWITKALFKRFMKQCRVAVFLEIRKPPAHIRVRGYPFRYAQIGYYFKGYFHPAVAGVRNKIKCFLHVHSPGSSSFTIDQGVDFEYRLIASFAYSVAESSEPNGPIK